MFTTAADLQTAVTIHVYQGERPMARDNTSLGQFTLDGLPPAPRGTPKIDVTFDIDASGILSVTAKDSATGKEQSIRITGSTRLPEAEKTRMVADAQRFAEDDRKRREQALQLNDADAMCYQAERFVADFADKIASDVRARLELHIRDIKAAIAGKNAEAARAHAEALGKVLKDAGASLYSQAAASAPAGAGGGPKAGSAPPSAEPAAGPRVVDAQYRETAP